MLIPWPKYVDFVTKMLISQFVIFSKKIAEKLSPPPRFFNIWIQFLFALVSKWSKPETLELAFFI